jgi:hypothetical protein
MSDADEQEFIRVMKEAQDRNDKWYADTMKKGSYVEKLTAQAARQAGDNAKDDGIRPVLDVPRRDFRYTVQQGLRAACTGREDTAAVFILMSTVLENQQTIKRLLWVAIAILAYIAYRVPAPSI